jgi:hypothetical protein
MKVLLIAIACAVLWSGLRQHGEACGTGGFVGGNTLVVAWLVVGVLGSALVWG